MRRMVFMSVVLTIAGPATAAETSLGALVLSNGYLQFRGRR